MSQLVSISKTLQLKKTASISKFTIWSKRYMALARKEKFAKIMTGNESLPSTRIADGLENDNSAEYDRIVKSNDDGYTYLILSVMSEKDLKSFLG